MEGAPACAAPSPSPGCTAPRASASSRWGQPSSCDSHRAGDRPVPGGGGASGAAGLGNRAWGAAGPGLGSDGNTLHLSGPQGGSSRVDRGGSWLRSARNVRAAYRHGHAPGDRYDSLGFRLARGPALQARSAVPRSGGVPRAEPARPSRSDGPSGQARSAGRGAERGPARPEGHHPEAVPPQEPHPEPKRSWFSRIFGKRKPPDEAP